MHIQRMTKSTAFIRELGKPSPVHYTRYYPIGRDAEHTKRLEIFLEDGRALIFEGDEVRQIIEVLKERG